MSQMDAHVILLSRISLSAHPLSQTSLIVVSYARDMQSIFMISLRAPFYSMAIGGASATAPLTLIKILRMALLSLVYTMFAIVSLLLMDARIPYAEIYQ